MSLTASSPPKSPKGNKRSTFIPIAIGLLILNSALVLFSGLQHSPVFKGVLKRIRDADQAVPVAKGKMIVKFEDAEPTSFLRDKSIQRTETSLSLPQLAILPKKGKFAYTFIVSGCTDTSCQAYVLNALAAAAVWNHSGSTADRWFQVRMASSSNATRLDLRYEDWLQRAGYKLRYLASLEYENFGTASLEKFRVLDMLEYDRVYFFDADLIPLCNTDYHMEMSYQGKILQEYVAYQGKGEPINAGNFIVTPKPGLFQRAMDIVHERRQKFQNSSELTSFDLEEGWGHRIQPDDSWHGWSSKGTKWNFLGARVDQGLLFYFLKYVHGNWTHLVAGGQVQQWREFHNMDAQILLAQNNTKVIPISNSTRYIIKHTEKKPLRGKCGNAHARWYPAKTLERDMFHYVATMKPWLRPILANETPTEYNATLKPHQVWLYWLGVANQTWNFQLPSVITIPKQRAPLPFDNLDDSLFLDPKLEIPEPLSIDYSG